MRPFPWTPWDASFGTSWSRDRNGLILGRCQAPSYGNCLGGGREPPIQGLLGRNVLDQAIDQSGGERVSGPHGVHDLNRWGGCVKRFSRTPVELGPRLLCDTEPLQPCSGLEVTARRPLKTL